jgi:hypothetical protein
MRDKLCYQAARVYKQNEAQSHYLFKQALQYPYEYGSPWTDAQIYSNMGMSCGNDYIKAYDYLQKAVFLGLRNPSIIKEINWIEIYYKEKLGMQDNDNENFKLNFRNYYNILFNNETKQELNHSIDLTFSHNRKRISICIHSDSSHVNYKATLTKEEASKIHDTYIGDNPNLSFSIIYGPFDTIDEISILQRNTNETKLYSNN